MPIGISICEIVLKKHFTKRDYFLKSILTVIHRCSFWGGLKRSICNGVCDEYKIFENNDTA